MKRYIKADKDVSFWDLYWHSVYRVFDTYVNRENKTTMRLWKAPFSTCMNQITYSKPNYSSYYFWDGGFFAVFICPDFKLGFQVDYPHDFPGKFRETDKSGMIKLSYADKDGKTEDITFDTFGDLCQYAKTLVSGYDVTKFRLYLLTTLDEFFDKLLAAYESISSQEAELKQQIQDNGGYTNHQYEWFKKTGRL